MSHIDQLGPIEPVIFGEVTCYLGTYTEELGWEEVCFVQGEVDVDEPLVVLAWEEYPIGFAALYAAYIKHTLPGTDVSLDYSDFVVPLSRLEEYPGIHPAYMAPSEIARRAESIRTIDWDSDDPDDEEGGLDLEIEEDDELLALQMTDDEIQKMVGDALLAVAYFGKKAPRSLKRKAWGEQGS